MWFCKSENGEIGITADYKINEEYEYTDEEIVFDYSGTRLLFKSQTETEEYKKEAAEYQNKKNAIEKCRELASSLSSTDYKIIQQIERLLNSMSNNLILESENEISKIIKERQDCRDEINKLEQQYSFQKTDWNLQK